MKEFISIDDHLFLQRLEWVFGIPELILKRSGTYQYEHALKLGVDQIDAISAPVFRYESTLNKTSSMYGRKDCALQALL